MGSVNLIQLVLEEFGNSAKPVTGKELAELSDTNGISAMVFLPSGDGYLVSNEEDGGK